jgi:hypothetical protein
LIMALMMRTCDRAIALQSLYLSPLETPPLGFAR